jgi:hypothetical protein
MRKTPAQKWNETISKYKLQCQKIMGISKNIRYTGIINEYGRTLTGIIRPGVKPLLKSEQVKNEFFIISTLMTLRKSPSSAIGELDYVVLKHRSVTILAYQKNKVTFYISINAREKNLDKIIPKIKKLI